jgi:hypothetical protein
LERFSGFTGCSRLTVEASSLPALGTGYVGKQS